MLKNSGITKVILAYNNFALTYLIITSITTTILFLLALKGLRDYRNQKKNWPYYKMLSSTYVPPVSILVPSYNEEKTVVNNIKSLLSMEYSQFEVVVINDGSEDETLNVLIKAFDLKRVDQPYQERIPTQKIKGVYVSSTVQNLTVIDKVNGGKADALNVGINSCKYPLFTAIDADSILEKDSLLKVVRPFIDNPDEVVVTGGIVRILNGSKVENGFIQEVFLSKTSLVILQTVEYLRAFLFGRMGWSELNSILIVSGAFGVFKKEVIINIGGYTADTIGEDMELIMKVHKQMRQEKQDYKIHFVPDPVCWTQGPEDIKSLRAQRIRWHRGLIDSLFNHKDMLFNPKYGIVGMIAVPYFWVAEMFGPVIEVLGYVSVLLAYLLGVLNYRFAILFFIFSVLYGVLISIGSIMLEENNFMKYEKISDYVKMIFYAIIENFGYRQLNSFWRVRSFIGYKRKENKWGNIARKEFEK